MGVSGNSPRSILDEIDRLVYEIDSHVTKNDHYKLQWMILISLWLWELGLRRDGDDYVYWHLSNVAELSVSDAIEESIVIQLYKMQYA